MEGEKLVKLKGVKHGVKDGSFKRQKHQVEGRKEKDKAKRYRYPFREK